MTSDSFESASPVKNGDAGRRISTDQLPPHEIAAEQGIIGCCLISPKSSLTRCQERIYNPETFYDLRHRELYEAMASMFALGQEVDPITLGSWIGENFKNYGGHEYLHQCQDKVPSAANLDYYLDILEEKFNLRKVIQACAEVSERAYTHSDSLDSLLDSLERNVLNVQANNQPKTALDGKASAEELRADMERRCELGGKLSGLDTGLHDLNRKLDGLQASEQVVVGARPSMGKTSLGLTMFATSCLENNIPSVFVSLEMTAAALMRRIFSMRCHVPLERVKKGSFTQDEFGKFASFKAQCERAPMHIVEGVSGMTCREICAMVRRMTLQHGIKLVVIDYMQKVRADIKQEKKTYEIGDISGKLKALAVETKTAMVTLAQLNRDSTKDKGRPPRLSDLADSGQIERDADTVVLIHRDRDDSVLLVAKQRDGETGAVPVFFNGKYCRFDAVTRGE